MTLKFVCRQLLLILLLSGTGQVLYAQQSNIDPSDTSFVQKYASFDFKGKFAVKAEEDERNNYYLIDFTLLPGRFEKVYFMNLTFKSTEIVNLDPDISRDRIWFLADKKHSEKQVLDLLFDLKKRTIKAATSLTEQEKVKWLKENDKYH